MKTIKYMFLCLLKIKLFININFKHPHYNKKKKKTGLIKKVNYFTAKSISFKIY
ncbi:hypothetical protein SRED_002205 [Spiroplasma melliferum]|uniref:Spiroplasmavirus-related protein n=1 Tax=Spiroplasma melliferum TaxID=2134 RepID=A0ABX5U8Q0_SPIME|nr:hypothetical protein SRED_002205 [Spiroplasma melliferum]